MQGIFSLGPLLPCAAHATTGRAASCGTPRFVCHGVVAAPAAPGRASSGIGFPVGYVHAGEYARRSGNEVGRYALAEHNRCRHHCGYGVEVNPVGCLHRAEVGNAPVPCEETHHRRYAAQKQQVAHHLRLCHCRGIGHGRKEKVIGQDGKDAVEKHLARDECRPVFARHRFHYERVDRPTDTGQECESIAYGRQVEHKPAVEHHRSHSGKRKQRPGKLHGIDACGAVDEPHEQRGQQRARAHYERGVGCRGVVHGLVFAEEIQRTAAYAQQHHVKFVAPVGREQPPVVNREHEDVGNEKPERENLCRRESVEHEYFGGNKGSAPHCNGEKRHEMIF